MVGFGSGKLMVLDGCDPQYWLKVKMYRFEIPVKKLKCLPQIR